MKVVTENPRIYDLRFTIYAVEGIGIRNLLAPTPVEHALQQDNPPLPSRKSDCAAMLRESKRLSTDQPKPHANSSDA